LGWFQWKADVSDPCVLSYIAMYALSFLLRFYAAAAAIIIIIIVVVVVVVVVEFH
jgi:hypothetical protein